MTSIKIVQNFKKDYSIIERLLSVLKEISIRFHQENQPFNIDSVEDHKGELTVNWLEEPSSIQKEIVELVWENENEFKEHVVHLVKKDI